MLSKHNECLSETAGNQKETEQNYQGTYSPDSMDWTYCGHTNNACHDRQRQL